jgi:hypothetical protein
MIFNILDVLDEAAGVEDPDGGYVGDACSFRFQDAGATVQD